MRKHRPLISVLLTGLAVVMTTSAALAQSKPAPGTAQKPGLDIMLMKPTAAKAGDNQFEVMVKGSDSKPFTKADVSILLVMPPTGAMAEMRNEIKLKEAAAGTYTGSGSVMMSGKWDATISVKQNGKEIGQKKVSLTAK